MRYYNIKLKTNSGKLLTTTMLGKDDEVVLELARKRAVDATGEEVVSYQITGNQEPEAKGGPKSR
jgi:hypothetical protein